MALSRLREKLTKENLWLYIISELRKGPKYGYELKEDLRRIYGVNVATITIYIVLYRMEREGLIRKVREELSGRRRVFYEVTPKGLETYRKGIEFIEEVVASLKGD